MNSKPSQCPRYISGAVMQYDWGRFGYESAVASLAHSNTPHLIDMNDSKPFAELWFGTHLKGVNHILPTNTLPSGLKVCDGSIKTTESLPEVTHAEVGHLPFLFKVCFQLFFFVY